MLSGYQWWKSQKIGNAQILKVNPNEKFTTRSRQVDHIWIVESSHNSMSGSLADLAKQRIKTRDSPSFNHFDEYKKVRQSCWIIEESEGDFFCDCPVCMKVTYKLNALCVNMCDVFRVS